jgi:hypothetical protein
MMPIDEPDWSRIPNPSSAMREAVYGYIMFGQPVGDFLRAFICNDLKGAASRADDVNGPLLYEWVRWFYNQAPGVCWGSPQRFHAWIERGGVKGHPDTDTTTTEQQL